MSPVLRNAGPQDAAAMATILGAWVAETAWMPKLHSAEQTLRFASHLLEGHLVRVAGDPATGFLARQSGEISALYLAATARGRGIGAALLAEAKAAEPALSLWTFQANLRARAFYAREGFQEVGMTAGDDNEERLPDVRLVWMALK